MKIVILILFALMSNLALAKTTAGEAADLAAVQRCFMNSIPAVDRMMANPTNEESSNKAQKMVAACNTKQDAFEKTYNRKIRCDANASNTAILCK